MTVMLVLVAAATGVGQTAYYSIFDYSGFIPRVEINDRAAELQATLYPATYVDRSVRGDMQWVARNDSALVAFWLEQRDTVLHVLSELSGVPWVERDFDIYLVRFYPTLGSSDPLIVPIGGMGSQGVIEAAPRGNNLKLNLVFQLAKRMLAQTVQPEESVQMGIGLHPLLRSGPNRLDNMALMLALTTCETVLGVDSTADAFGSAFWEHHHAGRRVFNKYIKDRWILTPDRNLVDWISEQTWASELVVATRPPRRSSNNSAGQGYARIEGLPPEGELGFSVKKNESQRLTVDKIDTYRLAYACGLREGDEIYRVQGSRVRNHLALVEAVLSEMRNGGAVLDILREGQSVAVIIQPLKSNDEEYDYEFYPEDVYESDTLQADTSAVEDGAIR